MYRLIFLLCLLPASAFAAVYGEMPKEGAVVEIAVAAASPEAHAGKAGKFAGRITQVCQSKGCWLVLEQDGQAVRVMAKDHGFAVPKDAKGRAVAYGVLQIETVAAKDAEHLKNDDGASEVAASEIRIVATGVEISEGSSP